MFKSKSRFTALLDDDSDFQKVEKKKPQRQHKSERETLNAIPNVVEFENMKNNNNNNIFKSERNERNLFSGNKNYRFSDEEIKERLETMEAEKKLLFELEQREKERKLLETLHIDNFPTLDSLSNKATYNNKDSRVNITSTFLDTLVISKHNSQDVGSELMENTGNSNDKIWQECEPGWTVIRKDKGTSITMKTNLIGEEYNSQKERDDHNYSMDILYGLIQLHERRTKIFIEEYGYDTWVNMFRYPNYDYDYIERMEENSDDGYTYDDECSEDDYGYEYDDY